VKHFGQGGKEIVERILSSSEAKQRMQGLKIVSVTDRVARECIDLAYGFFTPLEGFMGEGDVDSVCEKMTLTDGTLWPIPIVFDIAEEEIKKKKVKEGNDKFYAGTPQL
jgi:sulfate adenylyltransferase